MLVQYQKYLEVCHAFFKLLQLIAKTILIFKDKLGEVASQIVDSLISGRIKNNMGAYTLDFQINLKPTIIFNICLDSSTDTGQGFAILSHHMRKENP